MCNCCNRLIPIGAVEACNYNAHLARISCRWILFVHFAFATLSILSILLTVLFMMGEWKESETSNVLPNSDGGKTQ